jgi:uncharacterized membrane protein
MMTTRQHSDIGTDRGGRTWRTSALGRPTAGAILLGLGLGGFVDGIVLHQILQWHHMLTSAGFPATTVGNLRLNTVADGLFHVATWILTVAGIALLWGAARRRHVRWPAKLLWSGALIGWGAFNVVEGLVDHQMLGIHHVNETAPLDQWIWWDIGFLAWGVVMLVVGSALLRRGRQEVVEALGAPPDTLTESGA